MFAIGGMLKLPRICSSGLPTFLSEKKSLPLEKQDFLKGNLGHMHMYGPGRGGEDRECARSLMSRT